MTTPPAPRLVVGAAVVRDGRLLAARRTGPAPVAGRWELPGGKVEPGERPADALLRELAEELGVDGRVTGWLEGRQPVTDDVDLVVATVALTGGEPVAREHDRLRWLGPEELDDVDWLEPDRPFLAALRTVLRGSAASGAASAAAPASPGPRAIFFDEADARAVVVTLRRDGYAAALERERLAGEDDDEDHPWAVRSDAPVVALELLVDRHDGWLDLDEPPDADPAALPPPPPLPRAPRRRLRR